MWLNHHDLAPHIGDVSADDSVDPLIAQAQALAEIEIGDRDEPVSRRLSAVMTQIVVRMWRNAQEARQNPAGLQQQALGPFSMSTQQHSSGAGLALTNAEKALLRKAVGRGSLWVQPFTRGPLETASPVASRFGDTWDNW